MTKRMNNAVDNAKWTIKNTYDVLHDEKATKDAYFKITDALSVSRMLGLISEKDYDDGTDELFRFTVKLLAEA